MEQERLRDEIAIIEDNSDLCHEGLQEKLHILHGIWLKGTKPKEDIDMVFFRQLWKCI